MSVIRFVRRIALVALCASCSSCADDSVESSAAGFWQRAAPVKNPEPSAAMPANLADLTHDCRVVGFDGETIKVHSTPLPPDLRFDTADACQLLHTMKASNLARTVEVLEKTGCVVARETAVSFGNGSMRAAADHLSNVRSNPNAARLLSMIRACETPRSKANHATLSLKDTRIELYSVGTVTVGGKTCLAFLQINSLKGTDYGTELLTTGQCGGYAHGEELHHPRNNPDGVFAGNYYAHAMSYTGRLPGTYQYKGRTFPFKTDQLVDHRPTGLPINTALGKAVVINSGIEEDLRIGDVPIAIGNSQVSLLAEAVLGDEALLLVAHICACGNSYEPGWELDLIVVEDGHESHRFSLAGRRLSRENLDYADFTLDDGALVVAIPAIGTYRYAAGELDFALSNELTKVDEQNASAMRIEHVHSRLVGSKSIRRIESRAEDWGARISVSGRLVEGRKISEEAAFEASELSGPGYMLLLDAPISFGIGDCRAQIFEILYFEPDDAAFIDESFDSYYGKQVDLDATMHCHRRAGVMRNISQVVLSPETSREPMLTHGLWECITHNPDGTSSRDSYSFYLDRNFVSSSDGVEVHGSYDPGVEESALRFTAITRAGKTRSVDAVSSARVSERTGRTLRFATFEAQGNAERQVGCDYQGRPPLPYDPPKIAAPAAAKTSPATRRVTRSPVDFATRYARSISDALMRQPHPACQAIAQHISIVGRQPAPVSVRKQAIDSMVDNAPSFCLR